MATRILVSRTDRIGDVVLTLPLCGLLKTHLGAEILFLGRGYTRPVTEASPFVDASLDWSAVERAPPRGQRDFIGDIGADVIIHVFPNRAIARAARGAGVPRRIGTSHRIYHWLYCNELERVGRRHSDLHEAQLNVRLAARLLGRAQWDLADLIPFGRLEPRVPLPPDIAALLDRHRLNVVVQPRSRGGSREWPLDRWSRLIEALDPDRFRLFLSGSRDEGDQLREWIAALPRDVVDVTGLPLAELIAFFARVDGVVAASTGPLHLAAAVGVNALGLFPPTPPIHPGRWAPLGPRASVLCGPRTCARCRSANGSCDCMRAIAPEAVVARLEAWTPAGERRAE